MGIRLSKYIDDRGIDIENSDVLKDLKNLLQKEQDGKLASEEEAKLNDYKDRLQRFDDHVKILSSQAFSSIERDYRSWDKRGLLNDDEFLSCMASNLGNAQEMKQILFEKYIELGHTKHLDDINYLERDTWLRPE